MLWIAIAFVVAMMIGFLVPRKPLKLDLKGPPKSPPPSTTSSGGQTSSGDQTSR